LFFFYNPASGLREVTLGPEDARTASSTDHWWRINHESLATVLFQAGDRTRAADEFEKIGQLPRRGDALIAAALCREMTGDTLARRRLIDQAAKAMGGSRSQAVDSLVQLRRRIQMLGP
jgi:hypothetical protein